MNVPQPPAVPSPLLPLERHLRARRDGGRKLLVPYLTGGLDGWLDLAEACAAAGADAIEVGIPFSDPSMDGPTIQEASAKALTQGATPTRILAELAARPLGVPVVVMTYYNLLFRAGPSRFAGELADAGVGGTIFPDLPLEEAGPWTAEADRHDIANIMLIAPITPPQRVQRLCEASRGYVYGVSVMGTTGQRDELAATATVMGERIRAATDKPALVGFGVSTPKHAATAAATCDGVIVGSALVKRVLASASPDDAASLIGEMRRAMDAATG